MNACENYNWLMESHGKKIESELNNLYSTLGQFHNLSETIIQHALSSSDCKVIICFHYIIIKLKIYFSYYLNLKIVKIAYIFLYST